MSASEKLKALDEDDSGWMAEGVLRAALPQIVAVVEAAEQMPIGYWNLANRDLCEALSTLESALGGDVT